MYQSFFPAGKMAWGERIPLLIERLVVCATIQHVGEAHTILSRVHTRPLEENEISHTSHIFQERIPTLPNTHFLLPPHVFFCFFFVYYT